MSTVLCPSTTSPTTTNPEPASTGTLSIDTLVDATPASRDRVVDLLRTVSIAVVVLWHWTFSITHWRDGALRMPNPIGDVPGLWAATWLLQVMPLFFLVGGYANSATWSATCRDRGEAGGWELARRFWAKRVARLLRPVGIYVACWAVIDLAWQAGGGRSVLDWGLVVFVPLWFLAVYMAVVTLVPLTARWHAARPAITIVALAAGIVAADVARLGAGIEQAGLAGSALVWIFCHQLGYLWRDWTTAPNPTGPSSTTPPGAGAPSDAALSGPSMPTTRSTASSTRRQHLVLGSGLLALVALTQLGPYPSSMVAVRGEELSNMNPTTACIAALAVFQLGVVLVLRPHLDRWVQRRRVWRNVVAANAVAMTVFCWHMTALVGFLLAYETAGFRLSDEATAQWWLARPLWIVGPGLVLAGLMTCFARFELGSRRAR
jgi:hypothetical protein